MSKGRNELKKHVRAAKEWLGAAEESLDREENVKGDLSVMLARAELQHASEQTSESTGLVWAKRIVPFIAAVILATGVWTFFKAPVKEKPVEKLPVVRMDKPVEKTVPKEDISKEITEKQGKNEVAEDTEELRKDVSDAPSQEETVKVPTEEMQKLMCTAGQSLRAQ